MTREGWDEIAAWRDRRMGERGDLWHRAIIDPTLLAVVGPVRGLRVLDLGCGNGYLTRRWARQGAVASVGVDLSAASLRLARARESHQRTGARFVRQNSARMRAFEDASFDLVVAHMSLMDIADADRTVQEVGRLLADGGRFVFSIGHPCFDIDLHSVWVVERAPFEEDRVYRKVSGYRTEKVLRLPWHVSPTERAYTLSYHRPLPTYVRYLRRAGMAVVRMEEPTPRPEAIRRSPQGALLEEIPLHLVVEAVVLPKGLRRARRGKATTTRASRTSARTPAGAARRSGSRARTHGTGSGRRGSRPGS
jgi:ubiquinone/menaquinone biosynthesis C-methylase UbiE